MEERCQSRLGSRIGGKPQIMRGIPYTLAPHRSSPLWLAYSGAFTHDGVSVGARTKVIEVDPRGRTAEVRGIAERPRRNAEGVLSAIQPRQNRQP